MLPCNHVLYNQRVFMSKTNTTKVSDIAFLHEAAHKGQIGVIQENIERIEDINVQDERGYTLLHRAAAEGNIETTQLLIKHGAINLENKAGDTPLTLAAINGHLSVVKELLTVKKGGTTILHEAAKAAVYEPLEAELTRIRARKFCSNIPLEVRDEVIKLDINCKDLKGNTPLHLLNDASYLRGAILLVSNGANMNEKNDDGDYALGPAIIAIGKDAFPRAIIHSLVQDIPPGTSEESKNHILVDKLNMVISELKNRVDSNNGSIKSLIKNCETEHEKLLLLAAGIKVPKQHRGNAIPKGVGNTINKIFRRNNNTYERF